MMSLDRRLREELGHEAAAIEPDVERQLGAVEAGARRRNGVRAPWLLLGAAIVVAAIILRLPDGVNNRPAGPGPSVVPSLGASIPPSALASHPTIVGTYTTTFYWFDALVKRDGLEGTWTMRLEPNGALVLSPPTTFAPGAKALSGITYSLAGDLFRTDLFFDDCKSVGNYRWILAAIGHLRFTSIDDACLIRQTFLTRLPWLASN
jgi:hypothetical protein